MNTTYSPSVLWCFSLRSSVWSAYEINREDEHRLRKLLLLSSTLTLIQGQPPAVDCCLRQTSLKLERQTRQLREWSTKLKSDRFLSSSSDKGNLSLTQRSYLLSSYLTNSHLITLSAELTCIESGTLESASRFCLQPLKKCIKNHSRTSTAFNRSGLIRFSVVVNLFAIFDLFLSNRDLFFFFFFCSSFFCVCLSAAWQLDNGQEEDY